MTSGFGGRLDASYPTDVRNGGGIRVDKQGLATRIALDLRQTQRLTTIPAGGLVPVQDPGTGLIGALPVTALPTAQTGDGTQTNTKLATMPARTFKANLLGSTAPPQDVNFTQVLEALGITSGGSVATTAANVSVVPPASQGYTNVQGAITSIEGRVAAGVPITASQITDSSTSGRSVLTGTAAQARAALGIAFGTAAGTYAEGNDARFAAIAANGSIDPKAYGAKGDGTTNDSPAWQAAVDAANAQGKWVVPSPGDYYFAAPVNVPGLTTICKPGNGQDRRVKIRTNAAIDMFNIVGNGGTIAGLAFFHYGVSGRCIKQGKWAAWYIYDNYFIADNDGSVASDIIHSNGPLSHYHHNAFDNFRRNNDSFAIALDRPKDEPIHCIENHIEQNYCGGLGPFLYIGCRGARTNYDGTQNKPEGVHVNFNSVQTFNFSVVLECCLLLRLTGNSFCISNGTTFLIRPTGPGILDVRSTSNWYDSTGQITTGPVIQQDSTLANGPNAVLKFARFQDYIFGGKFGAVFDGLSDNVDFTGSVFIQISDTGAIFNQTKNVTIGATFEGCNRAFVCIDGSAGGPFFTGRCVFAGSGAPEFSMSDRSKLVVSYETTGFKLARKFPYLTGTGSFVAAASGAGNFVGFILVPHGLAGTPNLNKCHCTLQAIPSQSGGAAFQGGTATFLSADATNITMAVYILGLSTAGNIIYNMDVTI